MVGVVVRLCYLGIRGDSLAVSRDECLEQFPILLGLGSKRCGVEVAQQAVQQLPRLGLVLNRRQIAGANQQFAPAHLRFKKQAQLVIAGEVVNDVDDRAIVCR